MHAAARELAEETGIRVTDIARFIPMPPLAVSSTRMPQLSYVFRVNLSEEEFSARGQHDDEIFSVECVTVRDLPRMINQGSIYVSVPLAILSSYLSLRLLLIPEFAAKPT